MTDEKREELLERDQWICCGCGKTACKVLLDYTVNDRAEEFYPDFAWQSYCAKCAWQCSCSEWKSLFDASDLLAWEEVVQKLYEDATENQAWRLVVAIHEAQSRTVNIETIIDLIRGANLIPAEELG